MGVNAWTFSCAHIFRKLDTIITVTIMPIA